MGICVGAVTTLWILDHTAFELVLFPLDVTNQAMVTWALMEELALQELKYLPSTIVYQTNFPCKL